MYRRVKKMEAPIIMEESYWVNSQLSIARYYGGIIFMKKKYEIVNKDGITLYELSDPSSPYYVKDGKAIPPGEPADLVQTDWIPVYKALGRKKTFELVQSGKTLGEALLMVKEVKKLNKLK